MGGVQEAAPNGDDVADDCVGVQSNGDSNLRVHNTADADANTDAAAIGRPNNDHTGHANAGADVGDTLLAQPAEGGAAVANAEYFTPQRWTAEELQRDDPEMQDTMPADQRLISIYGDTIHQNDG